MLRKGCRNGVESRAEVLKEGESSSEGREGFRREFGGKGFLDRRVERRRSELVEKKRGGGRRAKMKLTIGTPTLSPSSRPFLRFGSSSRHRFEILAASRRVSEVAEVGSLASG